MYNKLLFFFFVCFSFVGNSQLDTTDAVLKELFIKSESAYMDFEKEHGKYIKTNNVLMHYSTWGDSTNTPFVWVHGTYQNTTEVVDFVDSVVNNGFYFIAIDYYGHGLTPIPQKEVSIYHVADDIKFLLNNLKIDKTIIGGLSRGGCIASAFYDEYPGSCLGIVLEDGGSFNFLKPRQNMSEEELRKRFAKKEYSDEIKSFNSKFELFKNYYNPVYGETPYWMFASMFQNNEGKWVWDNPNLQSLIEEKDSSKNMDRILRPFKSNLFNSSVSLMQPKIIYRNLNIPMLIFDPLGDDKNEFFNFHQQNLELQKMHPNKIKILTYENAIHGLHFMEIERFTQDLITFIKQFK